MEYTEQEIEIAINNVKHLALITRKFDDFIVLAQNERDYETKCRKIRRGDTQGFFRVGHAFAYKNKH